MNPFYYLEDNEVTPNNFRELQIELNYDIDGAQQTVSINDWEFGVMEKSGPDGARMLKERLFSTTGVGILEGVSFRIDLSNDRGKRYALFNGYVDLWRASYDNGKVTAPAVETGKIDWLNDYADSFSFEYLYSTGFLKKNKFISVPYCIVKKQDAFEIAMTSLTIFLIVDKIRDQITAIAQLAANSANPLEMTAIPRLILQIIYLILLFASLIPLIIKLINLLVPPIKYHNGMYAADLLEVGCKYMGLEFKSTIFQNSVFKDLLILPEKYTLTENGGVLAGIAGDLKNNNEKEGFYKGTFGDFLRAMKTMFYAKVVIDNGILYFEPFDFRLGAAGITIPTRFDNKDSFTLNNEDFWSTQIISFLTDVTDRHTIQEYKGTSVQINQVPKTAIFQQRSLLRNLDEVRIPFALGKVKTDLSTIEQLLLDFSAGIQLVLTIIVVGLNIAILAINILIAIIQKILKALSTIGIKIKLKLNPIKKIPTPSIKNIIKNRVGMLKMESDFVTVAKAFLFNRSAKKIPSNNQQIVNAKYLFDNYYYYKSFVSVNGKPSNQFLLKENPEFPFTFSDYETVRNNNAIFTEEGQEGIIQSLTFNPMKQTASCRYKVRQEYISNLKLVINEPDGQ